MRSLSDKFKLNNGYGIPCIGLGTWQTENGEIAVNSVKAAIKNGYRHIDGAAAYDNEECVGKGIKESGVDREELFITSKLWNTERGYEKTKKALDKTLKDLQLEYLDLYLIHWPANEKQFENWEEINVDTWRALEDAYKGGKVKAIGVSNFMPHHMKAILENCRIKPMVNQIEYHPGQMQSHVVELCKENNILVEAWSPLGTGRMLNNELLMSIAEKYNKSVAQLCIKWVLQNGILPLPKSVNENRIIDNSKVFDFEISAEDMETINNMEYAGGSGLNPDEVDF